MTRSKTNRKVGPKSKEFPNGKHRSLLQTTSYSESSDQPFNKDGWERWKKETGGNWSWRLQPLIDECKHIATTYLENSPYDHTKCENWKWGLMTSEESKSASELNGGFDSAFKMLFDIYLIEKALGKNDIEGAVINSLRLVFRARMLVIAELEPLFHAGKTKTEAANKSKIEGKLSIMTLAKPIYQGYLDKGQSKTNAGKLTSTYLVDNHGIIRDGETIRGWFKQPNIKNHL